MKAERRMAELYHLDVCENGHVNAARHRGKAAQVRCDHCKRWTWEDGNFCVQCGHGIRATGEVM
jgi:hypothetical protein